MNPRQREAVFTVEGPLLVLAGAGSGKTTVLVNRIANLIRYGSAYESEGEPDLTPEETAEAERFLAQGGELNPSVRERIAVNPCRPWQVLAITFTNKAAGEMKSRISARLGEAGDEVWASTFHSTCSRILRRAAERLGYTGHFTVYDSDDSKRLMKDCMKKLEIDEKKLRRRRFWPRSPTPRTA